MTTEYSHVHCIARIDVIFYLQLFLVLNNYIIVNSFISLP